MYMQIHLGVNLDTETLLTSEEAVITAAASEALALAKAAVKVAKDAAMMVSHRTSIKSDSTTAGTVLEVDTSTFEKSQLRHLAEKVVFRGAKVAQIGMTENNPASQPLADSHDVEPSAEELEFLEAQLSKSITVRSNRQTERKDRRSRAAEKAAANTVSVKSGSSSRKKRPSVQEVDYADPLRYLRGTTTTSKLLTSSEETVLSEGIQVTAEKFIFLFSHLCFIKFTLWTLFDFGEHTNTALKGCLYICSNEYLVLHLSLLFF